MVNKKKIITTPKKAKRRSSSSKPKKDDFKSFADIVFEREEIEDMATLKTKVESIEKEINEIKEDVRMVRDTITGVKGSWKVILSVGSILAAMFVTIATKLLDVFFK